MKRKLSYRKSKKGIAEQYGISLNKEMITNLGITKENREVIISFDSNSKSIVIKSSKEVNPIRTLSKREG